MKPDSVIKQDVDAELRWNPELDETDIATKVQNGVVTLSGFARRSAQLDAEQIYSRSPGRRGDAAGPGTLVGRARAGTAVSLVRTRGDTRDQ